MARPRTPDHIKQLQGTDQPCRLSNTAINAAPPTKITPPKGLTGEAKKIYIDKAEQLSACGALSVMDLDALYLYATNMAMAIKAYKTVSKEGLIVWVKDEDGNVLDQRINLWHKVMLDSIKVVNAIGQQLGYTPVSRQRIAQLGGGKEERDEFQEYENGY